MRNLAEKLFFGPGQERLNLGFRILKGLPSDQRRQLKDPIQHDLVNNKGNAECCR